MTCPIGGRIPPPPPIAVQFEPVPLDVAHPILRAAESAFRYYFSSHRAAPLDCIRPFIRHERSQVEFVAYFVDGEEIGWTVPLDDVQGLSETTVLVGIRSLYSQLFDDDQLEQQIRGVQEYVYRAAEGIGSAAEMASLRGYAQRHIEELRRAHYRQRGHPPHYIFPSIPRAPDDAFNVLNGWLLPGGILSEEEGHTFSVNFGRDILGYSKEAQERADKLLREWLSPAQLEQFDKHQYFEVTGCDTGKRYRILHQRQMNIHELDGNGKPVSTLCFLPEGQVPAGDCNLAQKIALETFEKKALKTANRFALPGRPYFVGDWGENDAANDSDQAPPTATGIRAFQTVTMTEWARLMSRSFLNLVGS